MTRSSGYPLKGTITCRIPREASRRAVRQPPLPPQGVAAGRPLLIVQRGHAASLAASGRFHHRRGGVLL